MKHLFLILFAVYLPVMVHSQSLGLDFDDDAYEKAPRLSPALRFSDNDVPAVYSLKKYCPTAGDQGQMGACVGWSTGYAALSISWAVKYNVTNKLEINKHARAPLFIYNQLKDKDQPGEKCQVGLNMAETFNWITQNGDCELSNFHPDNCDYRPSDKIKALAGAFPIESSETLFEIDYPVSVKVNAVIQTLSQNKPVVAGFRVYPSLFSDKTSKSGVWQIGANESPEKGGHAMCIVGYDNVNKEFEILNSWGTTFAKAGFFKISYKDFGKACKYGFSLKLGFTQAELDKMITLTGDFQFKKFLRLNEKTSQNEFTSVRAELLDGYYTFNSSSVKKDDFYRLAISNVQKDSYLYVFSLKPDHTCEVLFPLSASKSSEVVNDVALIPSASASVELPADDANAYSTDIVGDDALCLLYSNQQIPDIKKIADAVNVMPGDILNRLQKVLGNRLIPANKITYEKQAMAFYTKTDKGNIVPIILKVAVTQ